MPAHNNSHGTAPGGHPMSGEERTKVLLRILHEALTKYLPVTRPERNAANAPSCALDPLRKGRATGIVLRLQCNGKEAAEPLTVTSPPTSPLEAPESWKKFIQNNHSCGRLVVLATFTVPEGQPDLPWYRLTVNLKEYRLEEQPAATSHP